MLRRWGVLQNNLALSIGLIMWIGHRKEILNLTFRAFRPSSERIDVSTRPSLSDFRSICLSVCLSTHLSICLSFSLSVYQSVSLTFPYPRTEKHYLQFLFSFVQFYCCLVISRQITELILPTGKHAMRFVTFHYSLLQAQQGLLDKSKEPFSIRAKKFFPVEKAEWVGLFESTVNIEMNKFNFYCCWKKFLLLSGYFTLYFLSIVSFCSHSSSQLRVNLRGSCLSTSQNSWESITDYS